jgi:hypothetical protein
MISAGTEAIGGYPPPEMLKNAPPHAHWISHLQVADTNATVAKVKSLGGRILSEPHTMDMGTHTIVADPLGGTLALWQPAKAEGTGDWQNVDNVFCWRAVHRGPGEVDRVLQGHRRLRREKLGWVR